MNQLTTKDLIEQIKKNTQMASKRVDEFAPAMRQGAERRIREAQDKLNTLKSEYAAAVVKNAVVLAVDGPFAASFAEKAQSALGLVSVNYALVEEKILDMIKKGNGTDTFGNYEYQITLNAVNLLKKEYKINSTKPMISQSVPFGQKVERAVPALVKSVFGELINSAVAAKEIGEAAMRLGFEGKKLGVVLYNNSGSVDTSVLPSVAMQVTAENEPTLDEIASVFDSLSQVLTKTTVGSNVKASDNVKPKRGRPRKSSKDQEQTQDKE